MARTRSFDRDAVLAAAGNAFRQHGYRDASIEATPLDLDATVALLRQRLQTVDAMRLAVFGRSR